MSNNFPSPPSGFQLAAINYGLYFPNPPGLIPGSPFIMTGVQTTLNDEINDAEYTLGFAFTTPGDPGSFDQDTVEAAITQWLTYYAQMGAYITGQPLSTMQENFTVSRYWSWVSSSGIIASWSDTMPYTPVS